MPKPRSKRQAIRDERKQKRQEKEAPADGANVSSKRQRLDEEGNALSTERHEDNVPYDDGTEDHAGPPLPEKEFFGMLSDQEQEYFRSVDEQLDIDDFPSQEERDIYLANVFTEAQGKELKLACSQSCSRLMERLILMSTTRQKKKLFEQFGSHFLNLIQHRFASHCCETLFLQAAPVVTSELGGERDDLPIEGEEADAQPLPTMEELFLLTLDELEGHLSYLLTDRFASHTLRVLLIVLSGRPLDQSVTKSLIHSKKKEQISVPWTSVITSGPNKDLRPVPSSFSLAAKKIVVDSTDGMDATALRVLATHPVGNPVLQLLLELDISLNSSKAEGESSDMTLLWQLLPGAPASLKDATSPASSFISAMLYDPIGSRLLETLLTNCPGKLFKAVFKFSVADRIHSLVRNDVASYPAIRVLNRVGKEDLVTSVEKILPEIGKLVQLSRFNVIKTLFERCQIREATTEIDVLLKTLVKAYGSDPKSLVPKLCIPEPTDAEEKKGQSFKKNDSALVTHGSQLVTTLLSIPGLPAATIQTSLLALPPDVLLNLATSSGPTSHVLMSAFSSPSKNKFFHKALVAPLIRDVMALTQSSHGSRVLGAIISIPSKSENINLPFHIKEQIMGQLGQHEHDLRETYDGRRVWRTWRGDVWRNQRTDWIAWAKEVDAQPDQMTPAPWKRAKTLPASNANSIAVNEAARKRKREDVKAE